MEDLITDDELCDALGMNIKTYHLIVDGLLLKRYNVTGIIKIIKSDCVIQTEEKPDAIYSHNFNNINPKVVWAWNLDAVEKVAQEILNYRQLHRTI